MFLDFSYYFLINALSIIWFYCVGLFVLKLLKINFFSYSERFLLIDSKWLIADVDSNNNGPR